MTQYKDHLMTTYLKHQGTNHLYKEDDIEEYDDQEDTQEVPTDEELEDFKNKVKIWIEYDNTITKLKQAIRERKKAQDVLTEKIGIFMSRYNIEDLNTKQGKIRCKVVEIKTPLTQKIIKERLFETLNSEEKNPKPDTVIDNVFKRDGTVQKLVLRRLKNSAVLNIN